MRALLDELGIVAHPKTTGNRGIHVYVRLAPAVGPDPGAPRPRSRSRASSRAATPTSITDAWWKEERGERIFIDFNQNAPHKTVFGAWCVRARAGRAGVDAVRLGRARRRSIPTRRRSRPCPRASPSAAIRGPTSPAEPQSIEPLLEMYDRDLANGLQDAPWPPVYPKMPGEPPRVAPSRAKKDAKADAVTFKGWPDAALDFYAGLEADNSKAYWHAHKRDLRRVREGAVPRALRR